MQATYIIDFDSTLISCETLDELARLALADHPERETMVARLQAITKKGMAGELDFEESLRSRLELFRANQDHVAALIEQLYTDLTPSVKKNVEWFVRNAENIHIISGGFERSSR